jgi:two-component system sensor histidine kinase YesM
MVRALKKSKISIQKIMFYNSLTVTLTIFFVVLTVIVIVMVNNSVNALKESRLEVLRQLEDRNRIGSDAMKYLTEDSYSDCAQKLLDCESDDYDKLKAQIEESMTRNNEMLRKLNMRPSIIILMKNNYAFQSEDITPGEIEQISSSYWYIYNTANAKDSFWSSRYYISGNETNMEICYVKSILGANGEYKGVIIVSVSTDYFKEAYMYMLNKGTLVYILDENGKVISHPVPTLLGCNLYYMPYFWTKYEKNTSCFTRNNTNMILHTNVYSPQSGWTIVEEIAVNTLMDDFYEIVVIAGILFIGSVTLSVIASYLLSKKIARPIVTISNQMLEKEFSNIEKQTAYKEVLVLSNIYNLTIDKMNELITRIKQEEEEKRKLELSFLQAQINPHFLHNTLFSIKCLIEMRKYSKADNMLIHLMKLLKNPVNVNMEWIKIEDEIAYLESYTSLMQNRYENRQISTEIVVEPGLEDVLIPRLILQPIVENSIFHGFDDSCKNAIINIQLKKMGEKLIIRIRDNGKGMSKEELDALWHESKKNSQTFNRIGLINVRQRIKLLYGEKYGITVVSEPNQGTETILILGCKREVFADGEDHGS